MMTININYLNLRHKDQHSLPMNNETINEKRPGRINIASTAANSSGSSTTGGQMRSRLKAYMEEINNLQQQLSRLQDREASLKKMQKELVKTQGAGNIFSGADRAETDPAAGAGDAPRDLLELQRAQEKVKDHITEKLVARENILSGLAVIREKTLAENIMKNVKNYLLTQSELPIPNKIQLPQESILELLG